MHCYNCMVDVEVNYTCEDCDMYLCYDCSEQHAEDKGHNIVGRE